MSYAGCRSKLQANRQKEQIDIIMIIMIMIIMPGSGVAHLWEVDRGRRISEFD